MDRFYFNGLHRELRPDLVHGWGTEDSNGLVAVQLEPKRHVVEVQGFVAACYEILPKTYQRWLRRLTERITLSKARNVVAESHFALHEASRFCRNALMEVIEQPLRREFLSATPSSGRHRNVIFVGSILPSKGIMSALQAFASVAPDDWTFHIVGAGKPEDENGMLAFIAEHELRSRVRHSRGLGAQAVVEAMQESSIFLLPTRIDSGPTALKEALTMCLWPICYDNSGPGEYIRKYSFGSLVSDGNVSELTEKLAHCFATKPWRDEDLRTKLAQQTRGDFSPDNAWRRLQKVYDRVQKPQ